MGKNPMHATGSIAQAYPLSVENKFGYSNLLTEWRLEV